jgi:hypothetical protein
VGGLVRLALVGKLRNPSLKNLNAEPFHMFSVGQKDFVVVRQNKAVGVVLAE